MEFKIIFYKDEKGNSSVEEFLLGIADSNRILVAKTREGIGKLRNRAYHREPLSKYLEPGLWELRIRAGMDILRIIYTFEKEQVIILLHGFIKKDQKIPRSELEIARIRLKELKTREAQNEKS